MSIREVLIRHLENEEYIHTDFPYNQKVFWEFSFELQEDEYEEFWENNSASYEAVMTKAQLIAFINKVYGSKTGDEKFDRLIESLDENEKYNIISFET